MGAPPSGHGVYRVGIAPVHSPLGYLEHRIVLADGIEEAIKSVVRSEPRFLSAYEIREAALVYLVDVFPVSNLPCDGCASRSGQTRECEHVICQKCWMDRGNLCPICNDDVVDGEP